MDGGDFVRWGIAGTGHIAGRFAADIVHAPGARLAGVASRDPAKAAAFSRRWPAARPYGSLEDMTAASDIDAIYVASSNSAHFDQARIALAAGKPVLVEKPLAATIEDARALAAFARQSGVFAMEALWSRYVPAVREARHQVLSGKLGRIHSLKADLAWPVAYDPASRFYDPAAGGGVLLDLGVYPVSLARFFLGEPDTVTGSWRAAPTGVDIAARIHMTFSGAQAHLSCAFDRNGDNRLVIEGEKATLVLGLPFIGARDLGLFSAGRSADRLYPGGSGRMARLRRRLVRMAAFADARVMRHDYPGTGLQFEIEAASQAIRQGDLAEPDCSLEDSLRTLDILFSILALPPETVPA